MSRAFGNAGGDLILINPSGHEPSNEAGITVMGLIKITASLTADQWIVQAYNSSNNPAWGLLASGGKFYCEGDFSSGNGTAVLNHWMWIGFTKAAGSNKPEWYFHDLTAATAWSHNTGASNVADQTGPPTKIVIGGRQQGSSGLRGSLAAVAVYASVLTQTALQNAAASASALLASSPGWGVLLNQASTATAVTDLSGNGATQASLSGTSVDADDPPGFSYSLTPAGPTFKVWNGSAEVAATLKVWNGSAEVTASLSSITT